MVYKMLFKYQWLWLFFAVVIALFIVSKKYFFSSPVGITPPVNVKAFGYSISSITMNSKWTKNKKRVHIFTPDFYDDKKGDNNRVVIYKTDGQGNIEHWLQSVHQLVLSDAINPPILVAIETSHNRALQLIPPFLSGTPRDFNNLSQSPPGQGDRLLKFIKLELVPFIEKNYTVSHTRLLSGFSFGGLFSLYALSDEPSFFSGYFMFSPSIWVNEGKIIEYVNTALSQKIHQKPYVYASRAREFSYGILPKQQEDNQPILHYRLSAVFSENRQALLAWRYDIHGGVSHGASPAHSIPVALREFFTRHRQ